MNSRLFNATIAVSSLLFLSVVATPEVKAQSLFSFQNGSGSLFNNLPRTNFEPRLRTNFERSTRTDFGVRVEKSGTEIRLRRRLKALKPRLAAEQKYINELIKLVEQKKISEALVNEAFFYTLRRYKTKFPFIYFEHILGLQAKRLKATVPKFDRRIYSRENFSPQQFVQ